MLEVPYHLLIRVLTRDILIGYREFTFSLVSSSSQNFPPHTHIHTFQFSYRGYVFTRVL